MAYVGTQPADRVLSSADIAQGSVTLDDINFTDVPANMDITGTIDKHTMRLADGITVTGDVTISEDLVLAKLSDDGDALTMMNDGSTRTITGSGSIQAATLTATPQPTQTYAVGTTLTGLTGVIGPSVTGGEGLSVDATIADNSITLAKMASGTDGQVITYDASGNPVAVGPGTDGQVLTSTGAGSPPAFENVSATISPGSTIAGDLTLETSTTDHPIFRVITNHNDDGSSHPAKIVIGKDQADNSPNNNTDLGKIQFVGDNDDGNEYSYAEIVGHAKAKKEGDEEGRLYIRCVGESNMRDSISIYEGTKIGIMTTTPSYTLQVTGTVANSTSTAWTNTSDERVKTNIQTIENGLDKINKLRPVTYNYTEEYLKLHPELSSSKKYNSFIAQEYAEVFPDAVNTGPDLEDDHGNVVVQALKDYTPHDLFMYLVKSVQELSAKNDALEARIKTLEG